MARVFGINTKIRGKVGEYIYRQTKVGTVVSEAPVKPITPRRSQQQMNIRTQWANLGAIYKQFDSMLRRGFEELPTHMSVYNAFIQANLGVVKVYRSEKSSRPKGVNKAGSTLSKCSSWLHFVQV